MGNCCECTSIKSSENTAELYIRESISMLKIRTIDYLDFHEMNVEEFGMFLTEILSKKKTKFYLTNEKYENLTDNMILDKTLNEISIKQQKYACISYMDNYIDDLGINYVISLWALAYLKFDYESKIEFLFKILRDTEKYINVKIFHKFLIRYLRINLNIVTKNFLKCDEILKDNSKYKDLKILNKIYSTNLLEKYLNKILDGLKLCLKLNNENLSNADIDNEFLCEKMIENYFKNNLQLLDIISLRESVYVFTKSITDYSINE
jgi:hypothetical protein